MRKEEGHCAHVLIRIEVCEMFDDKLPAVAVMLLLCHDNASKSGK